MKSERILIVAMAVLLCGCGAKKKVISSQPAEPAQPAWHTCLIQGAQATVTTNDNRVSAAITMQTVRDSMIVISVMPLFGMEMMRIEATPIEVTAIDKLHGQYAKATYSDLNRKLTPAINWDIFQQLCTGELPTGPEKARMMYLFGDDTIELVITYSPRRLDVPVRVNALRTDNYTQVDVSKWL